jgi:hypothetical protein
LEKLAKDFEIRLRVSESDKMSLHSEIQALEQAVTTSQEMLKLTRTQY